METYVDAEEAALQEEIAEEAALQEEIAEEAAQIGVEEGEEAAAQGEAAELHVSQVAADAAIPREAALTDADAPDATVDVLPSAVMNVIPMTKTTTIWRDSEL